jgi:DNA-directed RNA polymerase specialized sigma24 family protein
MWDWFAHTILKAVDAAILTRVILSDIECEFAKIDFSRGFRFRAWLQKAAHDAWLRGMESPQVSAAVRALLKSTDAHDDFLQHLDETCSQVRRREAAARVRSRVDLAVWEAFSLLTFDGLNGAAAAERVGASVASVYVARHRVCLLLEDEFAVLNEQC